MRINCSFLLFFLVLAQAAFSQKLSKTDLSALYSEYSTSFVEAVIYHTSDAFSKVYVNIQDPVESSPEEETIQMTGFILRYEVFASFKDEDPLDSGFIDLADSVFSEKQTNRTVSFDIAAPFPGEYLLRIVLTDLTDSLKIASGIFNIFKTSRFSAQNFLLTEEDGTPFFNPWLSGNAYFRIRYNNPDTTRLYIRYFNTSFPLAKPPFALDKNLTYTFDPDSFFTVPLEGGITPLQELPYKGIYHLQASINDRDGKTLFRYYDGFPEVKAPAQALAPLRYLTTEREFDLLLQYDNYKTAIDSFWLERASYNTERAKNMIRRYYQRVEQSNRLFSSFQEGWKTDRGLIYIIYGPPSEVYRKDDEEEWIYGEKGNPMSIRFYFFRVDNPFSQNDFSLQRSPIYKTNWFIAVENWRR